MNHDSVSVEKFSWVAWNCSEESVVGGEFFQQEQFSCLNLFNSVQCTFVCEHYIIVLSYLLQWPDQVEIMSVTPSPEHLYW